MEDKNELLEKSRLKISKLFYPAGNLSTEIQYSKKNFDVPISMENEKQVVDLCAALNAKMVCFFLTR